MSESSNRFLLEWIAVLLQRTYDNSHSHHEADPELAGTGQILKMTPEALNRSLHKPGMLLLGHEQTMSLARKPVSLLGGQEGISGGLRLIEH